MSKTNTIIKYAHNAAAGFFIAIVVLAVASVTYGSLVGASASTLSMDKLELHTENEAKRGLIEIHENQITILRAEIEVNSAKYALLELQEDSPDFQ